MRLSIITITLNSEETIRDTLNSVLSQTYKNIEHIVVDGGSNDETLSILKSIKIKIKKFSLKKGSASINQLITELRKLEGNTL